MNLARCGLIKAIPFLVLLVVYCSDAAPQPPFRNRNLMPFPRVGRTPQELDVLDKLNDEYFTDRRIRRNGSKNINTGLWFGPRLGRLQKRQNYLDDAMEYLFLRDLSSKKRTSNKYIPRLGRDSEEIFDDFSENNQTSY